MRQLLVSGGRNNHLNKAGFEYLTLLHQKYKFNILINGMATGIDEDVRKWASKEQLSIEKFPAEWSKLGRRAGPLRNIKMANKLQAGDVVVVLPGNKGTDHMLEVARNTAASVIDLRSRLDLIK